MNRVAITGHVASVLRENIPDVHVAGEYSEGMQDTAIIIGIINERQVVGRGNGTLNYNFITNKETIMYVTMLTIGITSYAPIDAESMELSATVQRVINTKRGLFIQKSLNIHDIYECSPISVPSMRENGKHKTWATQVNVDLNITEVVET